MNNKQPVEHHAGLNIGDIYYVLFRQKWIILSFFAMGLLAAGALFIVKPALYESDARLYVQVHHVGAEPRSKWERTQHSNDRSQWRQHSKHGTAVFDEPGRGPQVVTNLGAAKIFAAYGVGHNTNSAVAMVIKNLILDDTPKTPSIIHIAFQHPDAGVARDILHEIIVTYINKSADMHSTMHFSPESLALAIDQMHEKIAETEKHLREAKQDAGIISSLEDTRKGLNDQFRKTRRPFWTRKPCCPRTARICRML